MASNPTESESEYLQRQAREAQAAIKQTARELGRELGEAINPQALVRQFPWVAMGMAAATGFAATAAVVPKKDQTLREHWQELMEDMSSRLDKTDGPEPTNGHESTNGTAKDGKKRKGGLLSKLAGPLLEVAKTAVSSSIAAAVAGTPAPGAAPPQEQAQA